jgi:hypothetical protein
MDDNVIVEVRVRNLNPTLLEMAGEQYRLLDRDRGRLQDLRWWYANAATGEAGPGRGPRGHGAAPGRGTRRAST